MIYLDNAATSYPKAPQVAEAVNNFICNIGANAGRSSYSTARASSRIIYQCRKQLAKLLQVDNEERIAFTMNTTGALNTAIKGMVKPGDVVITSVIEHNSVMRPLRALEAQNKITIKQFNIINNEPDWDQLTALLQQKPAFMVYTAASNVCGLVLPSKKIADLAHLYNVPVILDAAQALGSQYINANDYDIVCFPGHKGLLGPMGTGGIYVAADIDIPPLMQGGTGSRSSEEYQPVDYPDHLESGTPNLPGIAGLGAAVEFINNTGIDKISIRKRELTQLLIEKLQAIPEISLHCPQNMELQAGVVSFTSSKYNVSELAFHLDKGNIACRMGLHCAPGAHKFLGTFESGGTLRLSPGYFNTAEEIMQAVKLIKELH